MDWADAELASDHIRDDYRYWHRPRLHFERVVAADMEGFSYSANRSLSGLQRCLERQTRFTWKNPDTGSSPPPIDMTVTIRQGLFQTHVSLKTGESASHSTRLVLDRPPETGRARIWYTYNNAPKAQVRTRSAPHEGVAYLEAEFSDLDHLTGQYFTDRGTTGDLDLRRETSKPSASEVATGQLENSTT